MPTRKFIHTAWIVSDGEKLCMHPIFNSQLCVNLYDHYNMDKL